MASRQLSAKKPKDLGHTLRTLLSYLGRHKLLFLAVAVLVALSALANLLGTYMIRPVVNSLAAGSLNTLVLGVAVTAAIYGAGVLSALGYTQIMVKAAQKVLYDIRRDLFAHIQTLPLRFFDTQRHGDVMSYFTNDVDTISEALNNSFAMLIQSTIQVVGTFTMLFLLNWQLTLVVAVFYVLMFLYVRFSGRRSKAYYKKQQDCLGELDGYIEEMMAGQKVVKVFNHEEESLRAFREKNEALRKAGTGAQSYAATMIPAVVSISYVNYALVAVLGGIMALKGMTDVGSLASYLVFVRQAAMPINQMTQQSNFLLAALAGAERVFEVLEQPPETDEGQVELVNVKEEGGTMTACAEKTGRWAWRRPDGSLAPLRGAAHPEGDQPLRRAGPEDRLRGLHRRRQDHHHQPHQPLLRGAGGRRHLRRHRRAGHQKGQPPPLPGHRPSGYPPVYGHHCRQHPLRQAGCHSEGDRAGRPHRQRGLLHPPIAPGL